jgi:hypothetical protein
MERSALKEELVKFVVEVLCQAADRLGDRLEDRIRMILRDLVRLKEPETFQTTAAASNTSRFMDLKQFGAYFSMKPTAAWKMLQREKPPAGVVVRLGKRRIRIDVTAFERWVSVKETT